MSHELKRRSAAGAAGWQALTRAHSNEAWLGPAVRASLRRGFLELKWEPARALGPVGGSTRALAALATGGATFALGASASAAAAFAVGVGGLLALHAATHDFFSAWVGRLCDRAVAGAATWLMAQIARSWQATPLLSWPPPEPPSAPAQGGAAGGRAKAPPA